MQALYAFKKTRLAKIQHLRQICECTCGTDRLGNHGIAINVFDFTFNNFPVLHSPASRHFVFSTTSCFIVPVFQRLWRCRTPLTR